MFPSFCGTVGFLGWMVMLLVWGGLIALVVWGIARLFPDRSSPADGGSGDRAGSRHGGRRAEHKPSEVVLPQSRQREKPPRFLESGRR